MSNKPEVIARFTLVVEYDDYPDRSTIDELIEGARGYGNPVKAELEVLAPNVQDMLR